MKIIIYLALAALVMVSCGGNKKQETTETPAQTEESIGGQSADVLSASKGDTVSSPIHLSTADFKQLVVNYDANPDKWVYLGTKPAIVDFWATWCPPCKTIAPILDNLAKEYEGQIYIYKVDVDKETELASKFGIQSIPTLLFIPLNGDPKADVGALPEETFRERIDNFLLAK